MSTITTKDGTQIYYKDWGKGPVVTLSHGWPLSSDAWDGQMLFLAQKGSGRAARPHGHASGSGQRRPAGLPPELAFGRSGWGKSRARALRIRYLPSPPFGPM